MKVKKIEKRIRKKKDGGLKFVDVIEDEKAYDFKLDDVLINEKLNGGEKVRNLNIINDMYNENVYIVDKDDAGQYVSEVGITDIPSKDYLIENWSYESNNQNKSSKNRINVSIKGHRKKYNKYTLDELGIKITPMRKNRHYIIEFDNGVGIKQTSINFDKDPRLNGVWSILTVLNGYKYWYLPEDIDIKDFRKVFIEALYGSKEGINEFSKITGITSGDFTEAYKDSINLKVTGQFDEVNKSA